MSDVDVVWLASPWPLVRYAKDGTPPVRPEAALLALADVVLSVDQVQQYMDSDKYRWHIDSELNTGVIFFRNSPGGVAVLDEWKTSMQSAIRSGNPNHDQFWLNQVLQPRGGPNGFDDLKKDGGARALAAVAAHTRRRRRQRRGGEARRRRRSEGPEVARDLPLPQAV